MLTLEVLYKELTCLTSQLLSCWFLWPGTDLLSLWLWFQVWSWKSRYDLWHKCQVSKRPHTSPHRRHPRPQEHNAAAGQQVQRRRKAEGYSGKEAVAVPEPHHVVRCLPAAGSAGTGCFERRGNGRERRLQLETRTASPAAAASLLHSVRTEASDRCRHGEGQKVIVDRCVTQTQIDAALLRTSVRLLRLNASTDGLSLEFWNLIGLLSPQVNNCLWTCWPGRYSPQVLHLCFSPFDPDYSKEWCIVAF